MIARSSANALVGQVGGAVHGHDALAGSGPAQDPNGAVPGAVYQLALARVQEDAPFVERRVEHRLERGVVVHHDEPSPGSVPPEGGLEVAGIGAAEGVAGNPVDVVS